MSKSNIVFQIQYQMPNNKKSGITNWLNYASKKEKADSSSIDENNMLKDYATFTDNETFMVEYNECFVWNKDGDISNKDAKSKLESLDERGIFWRGFLSFPSEFAYDHGLITKMDFYSLTTNVMPSLIMDMGLNLNNVEWMCTLHRDTVKHPHIHFCIFEKHPTNINPRVPKFAIHNFKSNVANYLIDNTNFYKLRDETFSNITGKVDIKELNKIRTQRLFSDKYRRDLNRMLLDLYDKLPDKGRLQYNSKNMKQYKNEIDNIINFILMHDSVKYDYAKYLKLLEQHQKELDQIYGSSYENKNRKYYNDQLNRLYTKIGNEILSNYKKYKSLSYMEREKKFLSKHIYEFNFKSRSDYVKENTRASISRDLYKICMLAGLNDNQMRKVFLKWINNSKYKYDVDSLISSAKVSDYDMSVTEYYKALNRLGYDVKRLNKFKNKYFYRELNYKRFINQAINHLMFELEQEEKQIVSQIEYELDGGDYIK